MKRIIMIQTLAGEREVFVQGKTYEIEDPKQLESFLKSGIAKLDNDPEPTNKFMDKLSDDEKKDHDGKVDKRLSDLRKTDKAEKSEKK